jgi:amino acid adenylation domain-containing protein/FkbM family methyltransferase
MSEAIQGFQLSHQQERLWKLALAAPEPCRARLTIAIAGEIDPPALRAALLRVIERHEILRTRFALLPGMTVPLQEVAAAESSLLWREEEAEEPAGGRPEPVVVARLETRSATLHRLQIELPALCADARSLILLARELGLHYASRRQARGEGEAGGEPVQYADYAGWQREAADSHDEAARKLWQTSGLAEALRARLPGSSAAEPARFVPRSLRFSLPAAAVERLAAAGAAGAAGAAAGELPAAPASTVLLAAWILLLQRLLGTPRVTVGVAVTGRGFAELEEALGPFSRYVPCDEGISETAPLAAAAGGLAGRLAELAGRQESFSWKGLDVAEGSPGFFPFGFEWRELPPAWQVGDVRFSIDEIGVLADRFVAKLACVRRGDGGPEAAMEMAVEAELLYDALALPPDQAEMLAGRFRALLRDAGERTAAPAGELDVLSDGERRQILVELNRTDADLGGVVTLGALFEAQARISPGATALVAGGAGDETLSYGELEARANQLARLLRRLGVGPEVPVALHVERSFDLVIALLAVAKAGGAYVPIDPGYPRERQDFMLADCGASLLLARDDSGPRGGGLRGLRVVHLAARPEAAESPEPLPPEALPENLAYVIYTSGSTGRPKGAMVSHAAIANRLLWMQRDFPLAASDRVLQKTPYGFDASIWEIFVPLLAGAQVILAEPGGHRDSRYLLDAVARHGVTVLQLVPSQLAAFVDQEGVAEGCRSLRRMFCGGEALPGAVAERLLRGTGAALCNLYGPTEAAIDASFHSCPPAEPLPDVVPIGRPLANVRIYLVDRLLRAVPRLLPGEILIGGAGLARGYLGRPELTAERFVPDPWGPPGSRLYRTGDLGRLAPAGAIEFLGRIDSQVKLRGVRIELGEIEARLREHPAVRDAVVVVREERAGGPRLIAYVVRGAADPRREDLCQLPGGLRVACVNRNEAEVVYREIFTEGSYLRHGVELADGACVVDVGANIGLFTLYVKQRFPASRVLAFEPIPAIFEKLRANVLLHGLEEVELFDCALAEREGSAPFTFYPGWSAMSGRYADAQEEQSVTRTILAHDRLGAGDVEDLMAGRFAGEIVECPLKTLSQVLRESQVEWIDLLKIDAEKSEHDVLAGIADEDWSRIGQVVIEVHDLDGRLAAVRSLLAGKGYAVAVEQDAFLAGTPIWNLYCVRPGRQRPAAAGTVSPAVAAGDLMPADLRAFLAARLPEAMVPAAVLEVDELPRLPNGKVDRKALAALAPEPPAPAPEPPRTPVEELLAEICADVLGLERVGVHANFFELGGHSLLATRLISRVRAAFHAEVSLRRFFDAPTIAGLAALLGQARETARPAAPPLVPAGRDRELPPSFAQQRLWFIDQLQPGTANYNLAMPLRAEGRLDLALLGRTLSEVVRRHEALRTRFETVAGRCVQVIDPPRPVRLPLVDLSALPLPAGQGEALRLAGRDAQRPFDLGRDELLRIAVLRLDAAATEHAVLFTLHHIISDGWSNGVMVREVMALYEAFAAGRPSPLPELPIQYADFAIWQREWLRGGELQAQLGYWRDQLAGAPQVLALPQDRPRPVLQTSLGASRPIALPERLSAVVHGLCRQEGATPFMVLLAAWAVLLGRIAGQQDLLLGIPIAGRNRGEIEDLIGLFVNSLVMRTDLSGAPGFAELVGRVRRVALDAYAHQDLPFERLVEELAAERDLAHSPLFQVMFSLQNAPVHRLAIPGLTLSPLEVSSEAFKLDLILNLAEGERGFGGHLLHNTDLFDGSTIERLAGQFERLLAAAVADPLRAVPELPLLTKGERQQLLAEWNDTRAPFPETVLLHQFFEAAMERAPQAVAAVCDGRRLTYAELEARSNRLARLLRHPSEVPEGFAGGRGGVRRGAPVGVWVERSLDMLVAVLGVLKAGGHYVALDAAWPAERVETILAATGAPALVAGSGLMGLVEEMRFRLPALADVVCLGFADPEPPAEAIAAESVRELWDLVAERAVDRVTAGGFVSAFTGEAMSEAEVDEYRDRVLSLAHPWLRPEARVLEVGNGSGLLLWEMASRVAQVTGVDPSPLTQERNREQAGREGVGNVRLLTGFAHELQELIGADERFDLVLLASTVQFFPGPRYLERVLRWALGRLAPGGALLVADVLDARRRGELRRAIEEHRGGGGAAGTAGAAGMAGAAAADQRRELHLDEGFFQALGAAVHHRTEGFNNELGFRYDVVLAREDLVEAAACPKRLWTGWHVDRCPAGRLPAVAGPDDAAYVIHTSGSTGEPKGIVVQHRPVANLIDWINRTFDVGPEDRGLFVASLCFDLSVYDVFGLLAAGGTVHVATSEDLANPDRLVGLLRTGGITLWDSAPAALVQLAPLFPAAPEASSRLRRVLLSGDWIPVTLPDRVRRAFPGARVLALGGATEATVWSNWFPVGVVDPGWPSIPYGRPIANARYHVLDAAFAPCPIGVPGDLYIGGDCLAAGYARPELTAGAFLPDPFSGIPGARLYRTGDRARYQAAGDLEFLGRIDQQVKVHGFRIELGEIEAVLGSHPGVRDCVVLAREDVPGDRRLVAYAVVRPSPSSARPPRIEELQRHLQARLPEFMIPGAFVFLEALPLTPNGKLDRQALPAPDRTGAAGYVAPADPVEELLAGIWADVLGRERLGVHDNFFDLGGHSLLVTQVASRIRGALRVELPLRQLFETPTIAGLARAVRAHHEGDEGTAGRQAPPLVPLPRDVVGWELPLSFAQQRLWFLDRLEPGSAAYNLPSALRLRGELSVPELAWIFAAAVERHEVLRTTFGSRAGRAVQVIAPWSLPALPIVDLAGLGEARREDRARALAQEESRRPFDLERGPLLRLCLMRLDERDHLLLMTLHHIVSDGWSTGVLLREIAAWHRGFVEERPATLPDLPVQYADFAHWQRVWLQGEVLEAQISYWRQQLASAPRVLNLPLDRPRPARQTFRGAERSLTLPPELAAAVHRLCRREDATPFMVLLAAWGLLLGRHAGQQDVLVGTPIAGRNRREIEDLIGCFVNTLALRVDGRGSPDVGALMGRVRAAALDGYAHQDVPFERLVDELVTDRGLQVSPLFQAVLALQNAGGPGGGPEQLSVPGLTLTQVAVDPGVAKFDLTLTLEEHEGWGFVGALLYNTDLFDPATADRLLGHFTTLLAAFVAAPRAHVWELPLLGAAERRELLAWGGAGELQPLAGSLHARFEAQAAARPDAVAVQFAGAAQTYGELDRRANRLAHRLLAAGVGAGSRVCLAAAPGPGLVAGALGILKAGCAYVPLDPSYPRERLAWMLEDAGPAALVGEAAMVERLPGGPGRVLLLEELAEDTGLEVGPQVTAAAEWPAYVIYTSGSTGRPKGVVVSHGNVLRLLASTEERFAFGAADVWTLFHSFAFDFSVWELWGALLYGGRLVVVPHLVSRSPEAMLDLVEREQVTVLNQTPSAFQTFQEAEARREAVAARSLRWVIFGGEALAPRSLEGWWRRRERQGLATPGLVNMYGITETTVHVTWRRLGDAEILGGGGSVIGVPLRDWRVYVLDPWGEPVPAGVAGELHVGGEGVAQGYLGRPELTAERFVPDGFGAAPGARLYRSGDLGRWRGGGELEYLGRIDTQVKVRGFRIELGEIEAVLRGQPGVRDCVVLARKDVPGDRRLVAYVVGPAPGVEVEEVRGRLRQSLPEHMVPSAFVALASLPLTPNGKVDRRALPAPGAERPELAAEYAAPRTAAEEVLAAIWAQVLGIERAGIHDNFFELGGDSILSLRVAALARERGLAVELADLFQRQTVAELGASVRLAEAGLAQERSEPLSLVSAADRAKLPAGIEDAYPLTLLQAGMLFHMDLAPDDPPYHNVDSWHLRARFARSPFERALARVLARHPVLRTSFHLTGFSEPLQLVHRRARLPVPVIDLTGLEPRRHEQALGEFIAGQKTRLLERTRPPQLRFHVHLRTADSFQLTLTENHAILDGWSLHSTLSEILSGYFALLAGDKLPEEAPPQASFRDFVRLERLALDSAEHARFWDERLRDAPVTSLPPSDGPVQAGSRQRSLDLVIPLPVTAGLRRLASAAMVPLKSVLLAAHLKVMALVSGQREVVTGLTSHSRPESIDGEAVRGLFLNTLPFRFALGEGTWEGLVRDAFQAELQVLPFRRYPQAALHARRGGGPLFETAFNYIHFHVVEDLLRSGNVEVLDFKKAEGTNLALVANFIENPLTSELVLSLEYDLARLTGGRARWWLGELYQRVLQAMAAMAAGAAASHDLASLLAASERHQVLWEWNDTGPAAAPGRLLHELFAEQAARTPRAVAVSEGRLAAGGARLSYAELGRRSSRLARRLRAMGVGPEVLVGLCAERTVGMVVGILGILEAGGAYVPLDPAYPEERLAWMIADARPAVLLTAARLRSRLPAAGPVVVLLDEVAEIPEIDQASGLDEPREPLSGAAPLAPVVLEPDNLAYVIYTSGSTGWPKGAMITHRGLANYLCWAVAAYRTAGAAIRSALHSSISFDLTVTSLFVPLLSGGCVRLVAEADGVTGLAAALRDGNDCGEGADCGGGGEDLVKLTPAHLLALAEGLEPRDVAGRTGALVIGGEALQAESLSFWRTHAPGMRLINEYGPTETVVGCVVHEVERRADAAGAPAPVPIGRPIARTRIRLLDAMAGPVPIGAAGELQVGGAQVCRGYLGRPELTAERFVPDPFAAEPGARLYRTGDRGRHRPDGTLEFLGRADTQVKVRGFRIELGEVEAALAALPEVREAAALVREDRPGDRRLVAYVVPRHEDLDAASVLRALRQRLPEPMVPAALVNLAALPLTKNGKVDRQALGRMAPETERPAGELAGPRTPVEELLAGIWAQVLGLERVGVDESFIELGGHSLLAMRVTSRVEEVFAVTLPLRALFDTPTVAGLAVQIEALRSAGRSESMGPDRPPLGRAAGRERSEPLPASFAQQRLWFLDQLEGGGSDGGAAYNVPLVLQLTGKLEPAALAAAWCEVVRRHEVLRTGFSAAHPRISPVVQEVTATPATGLPMVDLRPLAALADGGRQEARRLALAAARRPFDLRRPPRRALLLRLPTPAPASEPLHVLVVCLHHIVCDGWSLGILQRELAALYGAALAGRPAQLPPLVVQYGDYAAWQRGWLAGEALAAEIGYWRQRLAGAPALLTLPTDRPRPAVQSFRGAQRSLALPAPLAGRLRELGRRQGTTLFMTLLAAWGVQLARSSGTEDVPVGSPIANRNRVEIEPLIGVFANTLVLRLDLAGEPTGEELLGRVRELTLAVFAHQELPFEKLVEELRPERSLSHSPLFQVLFLMQQQEEAALELPGVRVDELRLSGDTAKFDLMLGATAREAGLTLSLEFNHDLFDAATAARMLAGLQALLEQLAGAAETSIAELPLLGAGERHQLLREWNGTRLAKAGGAGGRLLHELFSEQAARTPESEAVSEGEAVGGERLSYAELDRRSSGLARRLRALGVGPEVLVGLCVERTAGMVVGILGILKAGGAYVPLDPAYPEERLRYLLADTGAPVVVTQEALRGRLPAGEYRVVSLDDRDGEEAAAADWSGGSEAGGPWPAVLPENAAYVIYTSGSTGRPKGVVVSHRNVTWLFAATEARLGFGPADVWSLFHSLAFDFSVWEMWGALLYGGRVVVVPYWVSRSPEAFRELLAREGVTVLSQTPSAFRQLLRAPGQGELAVRSVVFGGEALDPGSLLPWLEREGETARLVNGYGITETTVFVSHRELSAAEVKGLQSSVIGRPLGGLTSYVLDRRGEPSPPGVAGELYIGGEGLSRGYLRRPELTAERFVPHPFESLPGARLYRSGDLVRYLPDGELEYLGRIDNQVKIRGFRIELGEVEAVLAAHPEVREAAALVREDRPGDRRLVAYVVPRTRGMAAMAAIDPASLRRYMQQRLPEPMLPAAFVSLQALPLTGNGKVDRQALGRLAPETMRAAGEQVGPRTATEDLLAGIWAQALGLERVGVEESFFELGGHSLLATRVTSRIKEVFGVTLPLRALFDTPTVAGLASQIEVLRSAGRSESMAPDRTPLGRADRSGRSGPLPVSFAQQRLWFLDQLDPGSPVYNVPTAMALSGRIGVAALAAALGEVVLRHEVLRTTFGAAGGEPVQIISPGAAVALPLIDLRCLPAAPRTREAERLAGAEAQRPFDLGRGPLLRSALLRLAAEQHVVLLTMHHIVCDGWSKRVLVQEVAALYAAFLAGRPSPLPALPLQYADFSVWQREWLQGERLEQQLAYWTRHLDGAPPLLALPFDRPRPARPSHRGAAHRFRISPEVTAPLKALGRGEGTTLFMSLLAAWSILLHRHSGQSDLVVGTNIANRQLLSLEGLIGLFANTVALRIAWTEEPTVRELLARVREVVLEAQAHQDFPFEKLVEALRPERDEAYHPIFQVMLVMQEALSKSAAAPVPAAGALGIEVRSAKFDLTLFVVEDADEIAAELEYDADLFEAGTIADLAGQLQAVLQALPAAVERPISTLPLVSAPEEALLVGAFAEDLEL